MSLVFWQPNSPWFIWCAWRQTISQTFIFSLLLLLLLLPPRSPQPARCRRSVYRCLIKSCFVLFVFFLLAPYALAYLQAGLAVLCLQECVVGLGMACRLGVAPGPGRRALASYDRKLCCCVETYFLRWHLAALGRDTDLVQPGLWGGDDMNSVAAVSRPQGRNADKYLVNIWSILIHNEIYLYIFFYMNNYILYSFIKKYMHTIYIYIDFFISLNI